MLLSLDSRQGHKVADEILQTLRFPLDRAEKLVCHVRFEAFDVFTQCFDVTDNRRQWRPQFMAGIGDEIRVCPRNIRFGRLVYELDNGQPTGQGLAIDPPDVGTAIEAADNCPAFAIARKQSDCFGLAQSHSYILPDDMAAEQGARRKICNDDPVSFGDDDRRFGMFEEVCHVVARKGRAGRGSLCFGGAGSHEIERANPYQQDEPDINQIYAESRENDAGDERQHKS